MSSEIKIAKIAREQISVNAAHIITQLKEHGFEAYIVGGSVRDLLLGHQPKDFDIATNAHPDDLRHIFRNCRLIGKRFRLAHILFGREYIEVATFRANREQHGDRAHSENGMILRDNIYGSLEEDVWRRDFTVNALYYDLINDQIIDHTQGLTDLTEGVLRLIGDPKHRYREDPVRMLRALRFAAKLNLRLHPDTEKPLNELGHLLSEVSSARLFEECIKLFHSGCAVNTFKLMRGYKLFDKLFPQVSEFINSKDNSAEQLIYSALNNTDARIAAGKSVTPAFLFSVMLWPALNKKVEELMEEHTYSRAQAYEHAGDVIIRQQIKKITIPRRFAGMIREIWKMQLRLQKNKGKRIWRIFSHRRFRAGYDFLFLRAQIDEKLQPLANWWQKFQEANDEEREEMIKDSLRQKKNFRTKG